MSSQELAAVLRECRAALIAVLDDEAISLERAHQVAQAEIKLRATILAIERPGKLAVLWRRLFPVHTHCVGCNEKLPQPSVMGICWICNIW